MAVKVHRALSDPEAALMLSGPDIEELLGRLVELVERYNREIAVADNLTALHNRDRDLARWAKEVYGTVTDRRYTYVSVPD